jgi:hypothetical protein
MQAQANNTAISLICLAFEFAYSSDNAITVFSNWTSYSVSSPSNHAYKPTLEHPSKPLTASPKAHFPYIPPSQLPTPIQS